MIKKFSFILLFVFNISAQVEILYDTTLADIISSELSYQLDQVTSYNRDIIEFPKMQNMQKIAQNNKYTKIVAYVTSNDDKDLFYCMNFSDYETFKNDIDKNQVKSIIWYLIDEKLYNNLLYKNSWFNPLFNPLDADKKSQNCLIL